MGRIKGQDLLRLTSYPLIRSLDNIKFTLYHARVQDMWEYSSTPSGLSTKWK
jgi:hypothetical protein